VTEITNPVNKKLVSGNDLNRKRIRPVSPDVGEVNKGPGLYKVASLLGAKGSRPVTASHVASPMGNRFDYFRKKENVMTRIGGGAGG
jgi:hypothetical protein